MWAVSDASFASICRADFLQTVAYSRQVCTRSQATREHRKCLKLLAGPCEVWAVSTGPCFQKNHQVTGSHGPTTRPAGEKKRLVIRVREAAPEIALLQLVHLRHVDTKLAMAFRDISAECKESKRDPKFLTHSPEVPPTHWSCAWISGGCCTSQHASARRGRRACCGCKSSSSCRSMLICGHPPERMGCLGLHAIAPLRWRFLLGYLLHSFQKSLFLENLLANLRLRRVNL